MYQYKLSLFIFRRDLRLDDNTALLEAMALSQAVIPCFILDPRQCQPHPYRSEFGLNFLKESLDDLSRQLHDHGAGLYIFKGQAHEVVKQLLSELPIEAVFVNKDYTPFSITRDLGLQQVVESQGKAFCAFGDALLHEPAEVRKLDGKGPYTVFTPFFNRCQQLTVRKPQLLKSPHFYQKPIGSSLKSGCLTELSVHANSTILGGRAQGLKCLMAVNTLKDYAQKRDFPAMGATTQMSAHYKFGTVSIREAYAQIVKHGGQEHSLIRELYWRDFFTHIAYHFPHVFGHAFYGQFDKLSWENDKESFKRWCKGQTGFPLIDAGMRQLNQTGFMHNRVRMVVGSFLVKDLHLDWRWGEQYFATKLIDYDPCVNNGNWQWVASTGCDRQPYYRIFNPWLQQQKFDPQAIYIKRWVPELSQVPIEHIHSWHESSSRFLQVDYPLPMVNHDEEKVKALAMFKNIA